MNPINNSITKKRVRELESQLEGKEGTQIIHLNLLEIESLFELENENKKTKTVTILDLATKEPSPIDRPPTPFASMCHDADDSDANAKFEQEMMLQAHEEILANCGPIETFETTTSFEMDMNFRRAKYFIQHALKIHSVRELKMYLDYSGLTEEQNHQILEDVLFPDVGMTPLHFAARTGDFILMRFLIEEAKVTNIYSYDATGNTCFTEACAFAREGSQHEKIVTYLLENRLVDHLSESNKLAALDHLAKQGNLYMIHRIVGALFDETVNKNKLLNKLRKEINNNH